jgi:hypothetical protein
MIEYGVPAGTGNKRRAMLMSAYLRILLPHLSSSIFISII